MNKVQNAGVRMTARPERTDIEKKRPPASLEAFSFTSIFCFRNLRHNIRVGINPFAAAGGIEADEAQEATATAIPATITSATIG